MIDINNLLDTMKARFNSAAAADMDEVFQYDIHGEGSWHVIVKDGACVVNSGAAPDASVTLIMEADTFRDVINGETDGMQAFMAGKLKATGNMMLATRLTELFPQS